jgi:restriction endonuclease
MIPIFVKINVTYNDIPSPLPNSVVLNNYPQHFLKRYYQQLHNEFENLKINARVVESEITNDNFKESFVNITNANVEEFKDIWELIKTTKKHIHKIAAESDGRY